MAVYQQKVQESSRCSVHKAAYLSWPLVYARIPKKKAGRAVKGGVSTESKQVEGKLLYFMSYAEAAQKVWPRERIFSPQKIGIKNGASYFK